MSYKDNRQKLIDLLMKRKEDPTITYKYIQRETGYSKRTIIRVNQELEKKDIKEVLTHGNSNRIPSITASDQEISYIVKFKSLYPKITIAQFRDIYIEDIINNPSKKNDVRKYGLKPRSKSFFRSLFIKQGWKSPVKRRKSKGYGSAHPLRERAPRRGMLVQIDGTPYDWLNDGNVYCLHLAIDDASKEVLAGWFTPHECLYGYLKMLEIIIREYGLPAILFSDKHTIFKAHDEESKTKFQIIVERLGIGTIYANSAQSKGRVERYNGTCQLRLPNDIKRFKIKDYDKLNEWFNSFYKDYLNSKFSLPPLDPYDEFVKVDEDFDYFNNLSIKQERVFQNGDYFSYENCILSPYNEETGEIIHIVRGTKVLVIHDILHNKVYLKRYGKLYPCFVLKDSSNKYLVHNSKELRCRISDYIDKTKPKKRK